MKAPKVPDAAEPVATIVTDRYGVYVKDLRWLKKLDLPDGDYPLYLAPPSTAQAAEAALRKAAHMVNEWAHVATMEGFETVRVVDLKDLANAILALIPTEAAQVDAKLASSGTWSLEENVKALLSNPEAAITGFGYEWLTTVVGELAAQAARYRWLRSDDIEVPQGQREIYVLMERLPFNEEQSNEVLTGPELDAAIDSAKREG